MKFYATSFCVTGWLDVWVNEMVLKTLEHVSGWERVPLDQADVVLYVFAWTANFQFNTAEFNSVLDHEKRIVVFDYLEHGHIQALTVLGAHLDERFKKTEYGKVHEALALNGNIALYFKRELPAAHAVKSYFEIKPIDFLVSDYPDQNHIDSEEEFMARPVDILMLWGSSSGSRPKLAGELVKQLDRFGSYPHFALQLGDLEYNAKEHKHCPIAILYQNAYWNRLPMARVMAIQRLAKISISCRGVGLKCFRSAEAGYNAILAQQGLTEVRWAFPWAAAPPGLPTYQTPAPNALNLPNDPRSPSFGEDIDEEKAVNELYRWTRTERGWLYPMYKLGVVNNQNYVASNYVRRYLVPEICASL